MPPQATQSAVAGKTVVFTGTLERMTRGRGQGAGRTARRQGGRLGFQEDRLCRCRRRCRLQAQEGGGPRRCSPERRRLAGDRRTHVTGRLHARPAKPPSPQRAWRDLAFVRRDRFGAGSLVLWLVGSGSASASVDLELDPAVFRTPGRCPVVGDRLGFTEPARRQPLRGNPFGCQIVRNGLGAVL